MSKHLLQKFTMLLLALGFAVGLHAQVTTSGISGTVTDKVNKETLIGATVIAKHLPTGTEYGAVTNAKGNYVLSGLRPGGPYTIEVSYIGYNKKVFKGITLSLGNTEYLNVWLSEDSKQLEQVVIRGSRDASFNGKRTGAAANFSRKAIENAPNVSRSLFDIAKLTPQANVTKGGISFSGSNNRYNSFQIDGAVSNDTFGLAGTGTNGGQAGTNPISLEAIDALQVVIAPFDVRQGGFTGGGINAITKSGTNTFKGSIYNYYNNQDFYGTTAGDIPSKERKSLNKQFQSTTGFTFGGPIIKDKLFFFANGEIEKNSYPATYTLGNGSLITNQEATSFLKKFKDITGGYDGGGYGDRDVNRSSYKALLRLDWNINQAHKLSFRYSYLNAEKEGYGNTPEKLTLLNSAHTFYNETHSLVAELHSRFSNKLSNELRFGYNRVRDHREVPGEIFPQVSAGYKSHTIVAGTDRHSNPNRLDQDIFTLSDNLTLSLGDHKIVFGTHNELYNFYNVYLQNLAGFYNYSSIEDFVNGKKFYAYEKTNVNTDKTGGDKFWGPRFKAMQLGFYVQDEWKATDKLRLTYGLRMDLPLFLDTPTANDKFNSSKVAKQWGVENNQLPKVQPLWSPRIGFRYNIDDDHKYLLRGGAGIFTGRIPFVWISNNFVNTGVELQKTYVSKYDLNDHPNLKKQLGHIPMAQDKMYSEPGKSEVNFISKDFKFPQVARFNLALDARLPWGIKATIEGMFTKNLNNALYRNINVEKIMTSSGTPSPADRQMWKRGVDRDYTYLIMLDNTSKGYSYNFTTTLAKSFDFGLSASVAYTFGHAESQMDNGSSVAVSNWKYAPIKTSTADDELGISNFNMRHRIVANLTYSRDYAKHFGTTISLLYNGQSGDVFSMMATYDANGDGEKNDLLYLPTDKEIDGLKFYAKKGGLSADAQRKAFKELIAGNDDLKKYQGQIIPRNALTAPFLNQFDLHVAQNFYFKVNGRRQTLQLNADIVNVGNFFNRTWGLRQSVSHHNTSTLNYNSKYKTYTYDPETPMWYVSDIASRWHAQIGIKYIF